MVARHPASAPSQLPAAGAAAAAREPRPRLWIPTVFGFLVGGGLIGLPFAVLSDYLVSGLGVWPALVTAPAMVFVVLSIGLAFHRAARTAPPRAFGVGMLPVLAALGLSRGCN